MTTATSTGAPGHDVGTAPRTFRPDIEGLRAVAILLVVVYHAWPRYCPGGYVGVDVFFVISGFLITRQLIGEIGKTGRVSFSRFYARRARRILPAAVLVTFATVVVSASVLPPLAARAVNTDALTSSVFGMNYRLAILQANYLNVSAATSPLQHYWSLSVEEQFYAVWPALLVIGSLVWMKRRSTRGAATMLAAIAVGSFVASLWLTSRSPTWAYYSLWTRAWELALGGLVCLALPRLKGLQPDVAAVLGWGGLVAVVVGSVAFHNSTPFPGVGALAPVLGAAAVIVAGSGAHRRRADAESVLGLRPAQGLGRMSYGLYLWHFPALLLAPAILGYSLTALGTVPVVLISMGLAALSWRFVEMPVRRLSTLVQKPSRGLAGGLGLVGAALVAVALVTASLPSLQGHGVAKKLVSQSSLTLAELQADLAAGVRMQVVPRNLIPSVAGAGADLPIVYHDGCHVSYGGTTSPPCAFADTNSPRTVVLFGDSHAAQWFPALRIVAVKQHWRLVSLTKSGCPAVDVTVLHWAGGSAYTAYRRCDIWRRYALQRIANTHPYLVVTSWDRVLSAGAVSEPGTPTGHGGVWLDGVYATLRALHSGTNRVVLVSDSPLFPTPVPVCLSAHLTSVIRCTRARDAALDLPALGRAEDRVAAALGVPVVDPMNWFCTPTRCPVIVGNVLLYRDSNHVVPQYSEFLAPLVLGSIQPPAN